MLYRIDLAWRLVGTGLAFASLGLGGALLAVTVFPLIALITRDASLRVRRTQYIIYASFKCYIALMRFWPVLNLDFSEVGKLPNCEGRLIVANHPTLLDVVLLMSLNPRMCCIVKHQLWSNPYLGGVVRAAGYIRNDLPSEQMLEKCAKALAEGSNLLVFPEGTRTRLEATCRFQRGFANLAMLTNSPVQLALITCDPQTLMKGDPWYYIPWRRPTFRVRDMGFLDVNEYIGYQHRGVGARRLVANVEDLYREQLAR